MPSSVDNLLSEVVHGGISPQATFDVLRSCIELNRGAKRTRDLREAVDATVAGIDDAREAVDAAVALLSDGGDDGRLRALLSLRLAVDDRIVKLEGERGA